MHGIYDTIVSYKSSMHDILIHEQLYAPPMLINITITSFSFDQKKMHSIPTTKIASKSEVNKEHWPNE